MLSSRVSQILVTLLLVHIAGGFQFYLHAGEQRCFTETVAPGTKVLGEYTVSTGTGKMEVDISVKASGDQRNLYHQKNIGHGKFGFIIPFDNSLLHENWRVLAAEVRKRRLQEKVGEVFQKNAATGKGYDEGMKQGRKLLSTGHQDDSKNMNTGRGYERQFDAHGRARPPAEHEHHYEHDDHQDSHDHDYHKSHGHGHHHHDGHADDDNDFDDDYDDFDMDEYDGIHDEELDEELEHEKAVHVQKHGSDDDDVTKKAGIYEDRKIEICVSNHGSADAHRRRVRLIIHKGETAHDYTRLAKKEHMTQLEVSLRRVSAELHELMQELDKARQREDGLRKINEGTNGRVVMLALISLVSLGAVGSFQAIYTKRFLKRKKIL